MLWFELVLNLTVSLNMGPEFAWPLWCKIQHFSPGLSAGLEGLPWVPTENHVPWLFSSFSGTSFAILLWVWMFKHAHVWRRRFTVCDICEQFKSQLHDPAVPLPEKLGCVKAYRAHLKSQYSDRSLLWQLCDLAYSREGDIMLIWIDGMEQAKFAVPRSRGLKTASATILDQSMSWYVSILPLKKQFWCGFPFNLIILGSIKGTILGWKTNETALCDCNPQVKAPKTANEVAWSLELWVQPGPPLHRWDQQTWLIMHHWDFGPVHPKGFSAKCHQPWEQSCLWFCD